MTQAEQPLAAIGGIIKGSAYQGTLLSSRDIRSGPEMDSLMAAARFWLNEHEAGHDPGCPMLGEKLVWVNAERRTAPVFLYLDAA